MKKIISVVLCLVLIAQMAVCVFADNTSGDTVSLTASTNAEVVNNPQVATAYKLGMDKGDGSVLYFTGSTESATVTYRLATTTDASKAVDVYLEAANGGYRLYFTNVGVKTYIRVFHRIDGDPGYGKGSLGFVTSAPGEVFTYDETVKTLVYDYDGNNAYYIGTYGTYTTFSVSNTYYITGDKASTVDVSQFPARFYTVGTGDNESDVTEPEVTEPEVTEPTAGEKTQITYNFSNYGPGVQFADETYKLDEFTTMDIVGCHLKTQLRLYDDTYDGIAVFSCAKVITSVSINAGHKVATLNVYASADGQNWSLIQAIVTQVAYDDFVVEIPNNYHYLKLDAVGGQIRVSEMTFNMQEDALIEPEETEPESCDHNYVGTDTPPTSTEMGYTTYTCSLCGDTYRDNYVEALVPAGLEYTILDETVLITGYTGIDTTLVIPGTIDGYPVTIIDDYAFSSCDSLTSITIPDSVTTIGDHAFSSCDSLTGIWADEDNLFYSSDNRGVLFNKDQTVLIQAPGALSGSYTIPDSVTSIGEYAFSGCSSLTSITIPESVTSIGYSAFYGCSSLIGVYISDIAAWCNIDFSSSYSNPLDYAKNLYLNGKLVTELVIPDSVTSIGGSAFNDCSSLTSITIPDSVTTIGDYAFYGCSNLTSVTIGNSIASIGSGAFEGCTNLQYNIYDNGKYFGNTEKPYLVLMGNVSQDITSCDIHSETKVIYDRAFSCTSLTSITIPESITSIGMDAFGACVDLEEINFNATALSDVGESEDGVFCRAGQNGNGITVNIGANVTRIPGALFSVGGWGWEPKITSINFANNSVCESIDSSFRGLPSLTGIWMDEGNPFYSSDNCGVLFNKDKTILIQAPCALSGSYAIPDSVTSFDYWAFYNCSSLTSVTIGDGVTSIESFSHCSALTSVIIGNGVTNIDEYAFFYCDSLTSVTYCGTEEQWNTIVGDNYALRSAELTYHSWVDASCASPKTCQYCGTAEGDPQHNWCDWITLRQLTCTTSGVQARMCIDCSVMETQEIPALGHHSYSSVVSKPTCTEDGYTTYTCTNCGDSYNSEYIAAFGHTWSTWIVLAEPSCTEEGSMGRFCFCGTVENQNIPAKGHSYIDGICTVCGNPIPAYTKQWNISLQDDFGVHFYIHVDSDVLEQTTVKVYLGGVESTYDLSELILTEFGYQITVHLGASQMNKKITVETVVDGETVEIKDYSVRQYCDNILANESYRQYHTLVREMLNYGAAAQLYFNYDAENLANDGITGTAAVAVPGVTQELKLTDNISGLDFYGASLVYRDRIAVRYYFTGDVTDCTFTANGNTYTPVAKDGMYYVEMPDVLPQNIDQQITLTVTDANGNTLTVTYSPMNYIVRMNGKGSADLQNLLKALYNYHLAAKALQKIV